MDFRHANNPRPFEKYKRKQKNTMDTAEEIAEKIRKGKDTYQSYLDGFNGEDSHAKMIKQYAQSHTNEVLDKLEGRVEELYTGHTSEDVSKARRKDNQRFLDLIQDLKQ